MNNKRFNSLNEWLDWQESLHWTTIDLGLNRIRRVAEEMQLLTLPFPVITVAGTNGKGSTVALLESMLVEAGYRTGTYTSPYLYRYNERIQLSQKESSDDLICSAFEAIDSARRSWGDEEISLTYFEFATLASMWIFKQQNLLHNLDVAIMEVGMGGRLDAVNLWDADVAIITSIGIDHVKWLGDNREDIGHEKSGIMRKGKPVISGDPKPPESIATYAKEIEAILYQAGDHFSWQVDGKAWSLRVPEQLGQVVDKGVVDEGIDKSINNYSDLPFPALNGEFQFNNAAVAITALVAIKDRLVVSKQAIRVGLEKVKLSGRLEVIQHEPDIILDVAHNAHAAKQLAQWLLTYRSTDKLQAVAETDIDKTYALFSMLGDKDIKDVVTVMAPHIDHWYVSTIDDPRAINVDDLVSTMKEAEGEIDIHPFETLEKAWIRCKRELKTTDKVIVFGSFMVLSQFKVIF